MSARLAVGGNGFPWGAVLAALVLDVVLVTVALVVGPSPASQFGESGFVTDANALILLTTSLFAFLTFRARRVSNDERVRALRPELFWLLVAAAFVFLAIDEVGKLHESLDKRLHEHLLGFEPTAMSTRLDDVIVGCYGLGALVVCWYFRQEIARYRATVLILGGALGLFFVHFVIDLLNHADLVGDLGRVGTGRVAFGEWLTVGEESVKVAGGSLFAASMVVAWRSARSEASGTQIVAQPGGSRGLEGSQAENSTLGVHRELELSEKAET